MNKRSTARSQVGFSLVLVLVIGIVATLLVTAAFGTVMPSMLALTKTKTESALRSAAESALDHAVSRVASGDQSYSPQNPGGSVTISLPPSGQTGSPLGDFNGIPINATVTVADTPCPTSSSLYDPILDPSQPASVVSGQANGWRVVTAVASVPGGNYTRTLRAILRPIYSTVETTTKNNFNFGAAIAAGGNFQGKGGVTVNYYNSSTDGTNPTNYKTNPPQADVTANGNASLNATSATVGGDFSAAGTADSAGATVTGGIQSGVPPSQLPDPPSHPSSAQKHAPLLTTNGKSGNGGTEYLAGGDYYITVDGSGSPAIDLNSLVIPTGQTVRIWVEGTPGPTINLAGISGATNPANLQIYYKPSSPVITINQTNISLGGKGDFKGVVYAPNTNIVMSGTSEYWGAIVGNNVTLNGGGNGQGGALHYDAALANLNMFSYDTTTKTTAFTRSKCVSWEEIAQ